MKHLEKFEALNLDIKTNVYLKDYLSLKIGGVADYFISAKSSEDIIKAIKLCKELGLNYYTIGNGSNTLALDYGVRGVIIHLAKDFSNISLLEDNVIKADAGALLEDVCLFACENNLSGMEPLYGIPASVGGAVYMNAGAYNGEIKHVVSKVEFINDNDEIEVLTNEEAKFAYRNSYFMKNKGIIVSAYFKLHPSSKEEIKKVMDDFLNRRIDKQPLDYPSAGSTFKRPENNYASALIDQCGLKGYSINGIEVSSKHAGFVINKNGTSSQDFIDLITHIQSVVYAKTGFKLEPEIQVLK